MNRNRGLLVAGIAAVVAAALFPHAREAWEQRRLREAAAQRQLYVELKEREIACLERLRATGLPKHLDVTAEIARCRQLAIDPATGETVEAPF